MRSRTGNIDNIDRFSRSILSSLLLIGIVAPLSLAETLPLPSNEVDYDSEEESSVDVVPITTVDELRDVFSTDWAYNALESLAENYQCLVGFEDFTYKGRKNLSRAEFAVMLSVCLEKIDRTLQVKPQDLPTIERLRQEFMLDIALFRGKTDALQARIQDLEATQFSSTVKLNGSVNFAVTGILAGEGETQAVWQQRVNLDLIQSFTDKSRLKLRLTSGNGTIPQLADGNSAVVQSQQFFGDTDDRLKITNLSYAFAVTDRLYLTASVIGGMHSDYIIAPINPFLDDNNAGTTTLSVFAQKNAINSLGGGTGLGLVYQFDDSLLIGAGYYAAEAFNASEGKGLFNGTHAAGIKLRWQADENFTLGFSYQHGYFNEGDFVFDSNGKVFGFAPNVGTAAVNNTLARFATISNSYGGEFFWRVNPHFGVGGWLGFADIEAIDAKGTPRALGDGEIWNYALSFVFPDLGKEGNLGGIILGVQPYLASFTGNGAIDDEIPLQLEIFYRYRLSDNIAVTSGSIWQIVPDHDSKDILTGTVRVNFSF
jgi:hypothetical protein